MNERGAPSFSFAARLMKSGESRKWDSLSLRSESSVIIDDIGSENAAWVRFASFTSSSSVLITMRPCLAPSSLRRAALSGWCSASVSMSTSSLPPTSSFWEWWLFCFVFFAA